MTGESAHKPRRWPPRARVTAPWRVALCSGAFAGSIAVAPGGVLPVAIVATLASLCTAMVFVDHRVLTAILVATACLAGGLRGLSAAMVDRGTGTLAGHLVSGAVVLRGTVADSGVPGRDDTIAVSVTELTSQVGTWRVTGTVAAQSRTRVDVLPGDVVEVQAAALRAPPQRPGSLSAASLEREGITAIAPAAQVSVLGRGGPSPARVAQQLRHALAATVTRVLPEPEATLLLGIAFGVHAHLSGAVRAPLQDAGLIHIVAVSGLKVVMVAGLVQALAEALEWSRRRRTLVVVAVVGAYVLLSGAGPAALRGSLMVGAGLLLSRDGRRPHSFALLGLCAALLLAIEPAVATDVGFQLSFLGTAGILALASPIAAHVPGPRLLVEPFAVTIAAQLATAPVTAGTFGVLSVAGPLANAVVVPLLPFVIVVGGAGAMLSTAVPAIGPALGWVGLQMGSAMTRVILAIAQGSAGLPFAAVHLQLWPSAWTVAELAAAGAGGLSWLLADRTGPGRRRALALAAAAALVAGAATTAAEVAWTVAPMRLTVLDVGNGVAVLLRTPGGAQILVDGGSDSAALVTALGRALSPLDRHLDAVVLTAADRTTAAAIAGLGGRFDVGALLVSQPLPAALQLVASTMAGAGTQVIAVGSATWAITGVTARCLASTPEPSAPCVLQVRAGAATALITGNLPQADQDEVAGVDRASLHADLLVGPTTTAPSAALLAAVRPDLVAVPARRIPPGLGAVVADMAVTGRDSDLAYDALPAGGFTASGP